MSESATAINLRQLRVDLQQRVIRWMAALILVMLAGVVVQAAVLISMRDTVNENRRISEANGVLIGKRVDDLNWQKAVDASLKTQLITLVTKLATQVKVLGGDPGVTTITAPTTTTTTTRPKR